MRTLQKCRLVIYLGEGEISQSDYLGEAKIGQSDYFIKSIYVNYKKQK
ncbi:hypothetical protein IYC_20701 [Clostridium sporogenes PA 3679]|nr:hypothetical protein IYC_20701 [Clostridium sporogenes PA 3679]